MSAAQPPFRVLLLNTPTLLGDLLAEAMMDQSDFTMIRERDFTRPEHGIVAPDVVLVGRSSPDPEYAASILLARWPGSLAVTIADGGDGAVVYQLEPTKVAVGDLSPNELVLALRPMIRRPTGFRSRNVSRTSSRRRR
jgi:hypothetical protein